ncbi:MAG: ABC transporter substrate-binding protein [Pseudomonas sp.]|nr:ABC transporter substrate-binding protein [Pseudomonas sp.]
MRLFLLIVLCSSLIAGCNNESEPLRIGSNRWLGYAPIYLADELGWTSSANIRLVEYSSANGVIRGLHNGLLDAALLTLDEAIMLQSTGHDIEILLITNISAGADVLYARPNVRHIHELKGQRIAAEGGTLGAYFLSRILSKAQLSADDIQVVNLPLHMHVDALKNNTVDAIISNASFHAQLDKVGLVPLFTSRDLPDEIIDVLVVNRQRTSQELRTRLRALWFNSLDAWFDYRDKSDPRLCRRLGLDKDSLILTLNGIVMGDRALNELYFEQGLLAPHIQQIQSFMHDEGLINQPIDASKLLPSCTGGPC